MITEERTFKKFANETSMSNTTAVRGMDVEQYQKKISGDWQMINGHYLERTFKTKDFNDSLVLTNKIGFLASEDNYRPDITLSWGEVKVTIYSSEISGFSEKDFSLALKIDLVYF